MGATTKTAMAETAIMSAKGKAAWLLSRPDCVILIRHGGKDTVKNTRQDYPTTDYAIPQIADRDGLSRPKLDCGGKANRQVTIFNPMRFMIRVSRAITTGTIPLTADS